VRDPKQASSVWMEMPFMRGPEGARRLSEWARAHAVIRRQCSERRARVLLHDWAAVRLCRIFGYSQAGNWNGFVPPARDSSDDRVNTSSQRRELMELLHDIERFENKGIANGADQVSQA